MSRCSLGLFLCVAIANLGCEPPPKTGVGTSPAAAPAAPSAMSPEDAQAAFLASFRHASQSRDANAMLALYCLDGVDAEMQQTVRENIQDELAQTVADLEFLPADPARHGPRMEGSIRWKPNLPVVVLVKASYSAPPASGGTTLTKATHAVGMKGGRYLITVPIRD